MLEHVKAIVKTNAFLLDSAHLLRWYARGKPVPPPHVVKRRLIKEFQRRSGFKVLIETGTYMGDMLAAMTPYFATLYSIELSKKLFQQAKRRFADQPKVHLLQGDSGAVLETLMPTINQPCVFWLDGHYSGGVTALGGKESPIVEELRCIATHGIKSHIILIDDARCFQGPEAQASYDDILRGLKDVNPRYVIKVSDDIISASLPSGARCRADASHFL